MFKSLVNSLFIKDKEALLNQAKNEAKEIVRYRLKEIREDFKEGRINSLINDDKNLF